MGTIWLEFCDHSFLFLLKVSVQTSFSLTSRRKFLFLLFLFCQGENTSYLDQDIYIVTGGKFT